jgi:RNA polymerase sigma-70 factor (ECF subfamily)
MPGLAIHPSHTNRATTDDQIVELVLKGDKDLFEILAERHSGKIYRMALQILRNPSDAEDALQEIFLLAFTKVGQFRGESKFSTWLYKLALNVIYSRLRRSKHFPKTGTDLVTQEVAGHPPLSLGRPPGSGNPEDEADRTEILAELRAAIAQLPPDYRVVLVARDIDELSAEETAAALGLTVPAVKSRLHRARLFLKHRLEKFS